MARRGLGRFHVADSRDFEIPRLTSQRVERRWADHYWRGNQGAVGACVGFAFAHFLAAAPLIQLHRIPAMGIYRLAQELDEWEGTNYEGTSVRAGAKVLQRAGMISTYAFARSIDAVVAWVLERGPVIAGTNWYNKMTFPDANGFCKPGGRLEGGHAYCITRVNVREEYFGFVQSWEPNWGAEGRGYIRFSDMERLLRENGEFCTAVEIDVRGD